MKKVITFILCLFLSLTAFVSPIVAEETDFYVYNDNNAEHEEKAIKGFIDMFPYSSEAETDLSNHDVFLGKGIAIIDDNDYPKSLYPVWIDNQIVATVLVHQEKDGLINMFYTHYYVDALNYLKQYTSKEYPLLIAYVNGKVCGLIGDIIYDLNENKFIDDEDNIRIQENMSCSVVNAKAAISIADKQFSTEETIVKKEFKPVKYQQESFYCLAYATYNMLYNLGYKNYNIDDVKQPLIYYMGGGAPSVMKNWLINQGFTAYGTNSGHLTVSQIKSVLLNNHSYLGISASNSELAHAFVIFGVADNNIILYWDVVSPDIDATEVGSTYTTFTGPNGSFVWNNGYFYLDIDWN